MRLASSFSLLVLSPVLIAFSTQSIGAETTLAPETQTVGAAGPWGGWLLGAVILMIATFYAIRGPISLPKETNEQMVQRFSPYQRIVHWFVVFLFLLLSLSGFILLYGEALLEPLFGVDGYAAMASAASAAHELFGPLFLFGLLLLIPVYIRDNLPDKADLNWLAAAGGYFRKRASAHRFNAGEKIWFWLVCLCGLTLSISGLMLVFTSIDFQQSTIELAHAVHGAVAVFMVAVALGHVYLATIGSEGTLHGMLHGSVERRWAAKHHDLWLRELESEAEDPEDKP